ncbi:hypothetical protein QZH41_015878, partial [Actinostola sp. cb2023]
DGDWTEWSQWSQCENPCGGSHVNRSRTCNNPKPTPDGKKCSGVSTQNKLECIWPCPLGPVDGKWGDWSKWSSCPRTCGIPSGTVITRTRQCNRPPAMNGGKPCAGNATEVVKSCFSPCPGAVDGGWTQWSQWTRCTEPRYCLRGASSRTRTCTNPPPKNGGDECGGLAAEKRDCPTPEEGCSGGNCPSAPLPLCPSAPLPLCPSAPLPLCPSAPLPLCPSAPLPLCPSAPLPLCPSAPLPLCPSAPLPLCPSAPLPLCPSAPLPLCPSAPLPLCPSAPLPLCPSAPLPLCPSAPLPLPLCPSAPLPLCPSAPLPLCPSAPLPLCPSAPLPLCPSAPLPLPLCPLCPSAPLPLCPSAPLPLCPSAPLPLCPSAPLPLCPSAPLPLCPSAPLPLCPSAPLPLCPSAPLPLCPSAPLPLCPSAPLPLCPSAPLPLCPSAPLPLCPSAPLPLCPSAPLPLCPSAPLPLCPSAPLPLCPSAPLPLCPSAPLPLCPSAPLPLCPSAPLPLCPSAPLPLCPSAPLPLSCVRPCYLHTVFYTVSKVLSIIQTAWLNPKMETSVYRSRKVICMYMPNRPDKVPTDPNSFINLECETGEKFSTKGAYAGLVPSEIYSLFDFMSRELQNGWFGIKMEPDKIDPKKFFTKVCFEIIDPLHILKIVNNKASYYNRTRALPSWTIPGMFEYVPGITITIDTGANYVEKLKKYEFQIATSNEYVPSSTIKMTSVRFTYYTEGNSQTFKAKGNYRVGSAIFKTEIKKDPLDLAAYASGSATSVKFHELMNFFGVSSSIVPDVIKNGLKKVGIWDFTMTPASFASKVAKSGTFRFSSAINIKGVPIHVEVLTALRFNRICFAVGFIFDRESFGALAEKLSDINIDFLNSLGVEFEIGIAFSPPKTQAVYINNEVSFTREPLKSHIKRSVPQGLFIGAELILPKDCKGNKFCEICKNIVGPTATAYINGLIEWKKVTVKAGFRNIHLGHGFYFHKLELYVIADWNSTAKHIKIGFKAEIKIPVNGKIYRDGIIAPSNDLILGGVIEYDFSKSEVSGKLYFKGMWRRAFFINWLALGNIVFGVTYLVGAPVPITGVQFGMRAEFGYDCLVATDFAVDGHCFGGAGYVGVGKPQFYYAEITALTIGKICRMISTRIKLPDPIDQTGFPEGAKVSFSSDNVDLRAMEGPYIYKGFLIKGRVNVFGWSIFAHIQISETVLLINLQPDPIKIAGIFALVRSPTNDKKGPYFYVHVRSSFFWDVYIEGYINIFSISVYTRLNMTMTHMELLVRGNFLNLIKAEVFVAAEYSFTLSFNDAKFYIKVEVDLSGLNALLDAAAKAVKGAFEAAQKELGNARRTVIEKKAECKRKMSLKCDKCKDLKCKQAETNCKGALDKFGKWIGGVVNAAGQWVVKTVKKIGKAFQAVGNFVKKIFKGWRRKRELQNRQNELFALHIRRRRFISKLICEGIVGGGCKAVSFLCEGTCRAIEFIGKGLCNILDVAIGFLKGIEAVCGWVSKAIQFVLTKLFRIHSIKFEFSMESYRIGIFKSMVFNAAVDLTIFGKRLYLALAFSLTNPFESLKGGANKATHWYKDKMNPKGRTDTEKQYYDKPNPFADFEMSEQFAIENQQSATDDRKGGCLYAESKTKNTYIKVTGCNNTDERQLWAYTLKGQLMNIWSRFCIDTNGGSAGNKLIQSTCNPSRDDQNFQCDLIVRTVKRRRVNMCWQAGMKCKILCKLCHRT